MQTNNDDRSFGIHRKPKLFLRSKPATTEITTVQCTDYLYTRLRYLGLYMPENYKILYITYSLILNGLVTVYQPIAFIVALVSDTDMDMSRWLISCQGAIALYIASAKAVILSFMAKKLLVANLRMERLDARCQSQDEIDELHKLSRLTRRIIWFLSLVYWSYLTCNTVGAVIFGKPPYGIYFPYINWRNSQLELVAASLMEFLLVGAAILQQICSDSYSMVYVCIIRAHMKILLLRVSKLGSDKKMSPEQNIEELKLCIKDHKILLELLNIIAPVISVTTFIQFMVTACLNSIALINITIFAPDEISIVAACLSIISVSFETFPLCYYAQCLLEDNEKLTEELFHSNWIDQGARYGQMVSFFMQHTQRPMELVAGKLFPITLNTFLNIFKFSFTVYTFLEAMDSKRRKGQK